MVKIASSVLAIVLAAGSLVFATPVGERLEIIEMLDAAGSTSIEARGIIIPMENVEINGGIFRCSSCTLPEGAQGYPFCLVPGCCSVSRPGC